MKLLILFLIFFEVKALTAGADSSGGGYILGDKNNPWFLENKKTVSYCIEVGSEFDNSPDDLRKMVSDSLQYWKDQFFQAQYNGYSFLLGSSQFNFEKTCTETTDIKFYFGYFDDELKEKLPNPTELIGIALRTSYDPKALSGRGIVYISPDHGPLKFSLKSTNRAWSEHGGKKLYWTLVHEVGHVFGVQHFGNSHDIMAVNYPEWLIKSYLPSNEFPSDQKDSLIFNLSKPRIKCDLGRVHFKAGLQYLGISKDCVKLTFNLNGDFELFESDSWQSEWSKIGSYKHHQNWHDDGYGGIVTLYTKGDNWLNPLQKDSYEWLSGPGIQSFGSAGTFTFADNRPAKSITTDFKPNHLQISGIINDKIEKHLLLLNWH